MTAAQVKEARDKLKMTQREFALALNIDIRTVQKWEGGERQARGIAIAAIRMLLKLKGKS